MVYNERKGVDCMNIGEIPKTVNLSRKVINLYEEKGLIAPSKNTNGYRIYGEREVQLLIQIKLLRTLHFSIQEIYQIIYHEEYTLFDNKYSKLKDMELNNVMQMQYLDKVKEAFISKTPNIEIEETCNELLKEPMVKEARKTIDFDSILVKVLLVISFNLALYINTIIGDLFAIVTGICSLLSI